MMDRRVLLKQSLTSQAKRRFGTSSNERNDSAKSAYIEKLYIEFSIVLSPLREPIKDRRRFIYRHPYISIHNHTQKQKKNKG